MPKIDDLFADIILEYMLVFCFRFIATNIYKTKEETNEFIREFVTGAAIQAEKILDGKVDKDAVREAKNKYIKKLQI